MRGPLRGLAMLLAAPLWAADLEWTGSDDELFRNADNWSPQQVPSAINNVEVKTLGGQPLVRLSASPTTVNSIDCTVAFDLDEALTVISPSKFQNALLSDGVGRLRANGLITLEGNNSLNNLILDGATGFVNQGTVTLGNRGISTSFQNPGVATMVGGLSGLGTFDNSGVLNLGVRGAINSSTDLTNSGTLRKDNPAETSSIQGDLVMTGGEIDVGTDATLIVSAATQDYQGGDITVKGSLTLTQGVGGVVNRGFNGLRLISGTGNVVQGTVYDVSKNLGLVMNGTLGYRFNAGLNFVVSGAPPVVENEGRILISGSPIFRYSSPPTSTPDGVFVNLSPGAVDSASTSNPEWGVHVRNESNWTTGSMRVLRFDTGGPNATLTLRGNPRTVAAVTGAASPEFRNLGGGIVRMAEGPVSVFTFSVPYIQGTQTATLVDNGVLNLTGGSSFLQGTFRVFSASFFNIRTGTYDTGQGSVVMDGPGTCTFGGSSLRPELTAGPGPLPGTLINRLGLLSATSQGFNTSKGFQFQSGEIAANIRNEGFLNWQGGTVSGVLTNSNGLHLNAGPQVRVLKGTVIQVSSKPVVQNISLRIDETGTFRNQEDSTHELHPGASISGTGRYRNSGVFRSESTTSALISCRFSNEGSVSATDDSDLVFTNCDNINSNGVLSGGEWNIESGASIGFPFDVEVLEGTRWSGKGPTTVRNVRGSKSLLRKILSDTHTAGVTVEQGAGLSCEAACVFTVPSCTLDQDGYYAGVGQVKVTAGDFNVGSGRVTPGNSAGTAGIDGDTVFTSESTYEWEAESAALADQLVITNGTATLAGTVSPRLLDNYLPAPGTSFTILTAPTISGTFDFVDLSYLPPGLGASLSYSATTVTLTFNSLSLADYDAWKATRFTPVEQADPLISGPTVDLEGDGLTHAEEFAFGLNPKKADAFPVEVVGATATSLDLAFPWASGTNASYRVLASEAVGGFQSVSSSVQSSTSIAPGVNRLVIRSSHNAATRQFNRLEITVP